MPAERPPEFRILNPIRCAVFVLFYAQMFLLANWTLPHPFSWSVSIILLLSLALIGIVPAIRNETERQLSDRIRLVKFGVEYDSGVFGENWVRPYDEFRVACVPKSGLTKKYLVKLKHRVLSNVTVGGSMRLEAAQQLVNQLVHKSGLKKQRQTF